MEKEIACYTKTFERNPKKAKQLRKIGMSYVKIGKELGCSDQTAKKLTEQGE
ncbi:MAG: hypothetical protein M0R80_17575 [Proteobacteria bacterium]|jgi:orotate phosphoribosyltransferase-like protein|nr:hypothetical protein [Pseudomonadota bacterium]